MTRQVVAARTGKKNVSAHSTCTTGSDLCGMGHKLIQAWQRFFVKDYSIRIQRLVPADDDEPGVSALGIAAEDGHVLADRLVGAARQPAVVKQADLRIGRVEQFDFHGAFGRQPELGHLALRKRRRLAFHFPVIRPAEYRTQIFVQFRPDGLPTRVIRFVRVCSPNELNVESDLLRVLGPACQKPHERETKQPNEFLRRLRHRLSDEGTTAPHSQNFSPFPSGSWRGNTSKQLDVSWGHELWRSGVSAERRNSWEQQPAALCRDAARGGGSWKGNTSKVRT